jgi:hypothetical protein
VDIVNVEHALNTLVANFRDQTLNDLPQFAGLNPSIEHFTRIGKPDRLGRLSSGPARLAAPS